MSWICERCDIELPLTLGCGKCGEWCCPVCKTVSDKDGEGCGYCAEIQRPKLVGMPYDRMEESEESEESVNKEDEKCNCGCRDFHNYQKQKREKKERCGCGCED